MFREMRRQDRVTDKDAALTILDKATEGTFATISVDNGYPYTVAVNHILLNGRIYFHCAKTGHKIDNIKANNKISFFAISDSSVMEEKYTTEYRSVHIFGKATFVEDKKEFKEALYEIARKYTGSFFAKAKAEIASAINKTMVIRIDIEHISGKKNI